MFDKCDKCGAEMVEKMDALGIEKSIVRGRMPEKENEEIVDSQKLSDRDKKEIKEGLCVNCAIFAFIFMFAAMIALVL